MIPPTEPHPFGRFPLMRDHRTFVGFGQEEEITAPVAAIAAAPSPWAVALMTSVLGAATGWVIEEVAKGVRGKRKR